MRGVVVAQSWAMPPSAPKPARTTKVRPAGAFHPPLLPLCHVTAIILMPPPHTQTEAWVLRR